jgi:hypothetical protein
MRYLFLVLLVAAFSGSIAIAQPPASFKPVEFQFAFNPVKYTMPAPATAAAKTMQKSVEVHSGKEFNLQLVKAKFDPKTHKLRGDAKVVAETKDTLIFTVKQLKDDLKTLDITYNFVTGITVDGVDMTISSLDADVSFKSALYTEAQCNAMLEAARKVTLVK